MKFTCPMCGSNKLKEVQSKIVLYDVTGFEGDDLTSPLSYNHFSPEESEGDVISYQCECGYELEDKVGNIIDDPEDVVEWVKNNQE